MFAFSFTSKELQTDPLTTLRQRFEQVDIKLVTEYVKSTTHVVSKKRNTAKGLQALINAKRIVTESFLDAVVETTSLAESAEITDLSLLEQDFDKYWPDAMQHLPPRGGEPVQHPDVMYSPDLGRKEVFEGYTFIFYDQAQYNNLLSAITAGGGKALFGAVEPEETQVDEFVQYVKNVAGEKGLGAFDDGSEGKGVVLVRYLPSKGPLVDWYVEFITTVSLRLDHRPIEQSEFLEAILTKDASILRRPLQVECSQYPQETQPARAEAEVAANQENDSTQPSTSQPVEETQPALRRGRSRRTVKRRFAGFDDDADIDIDEAPSAPPAETQPPVQEEEGLFVSQEPDYSLVAQDSNGNRPTQSQRKRRASPLPEDDLMEDMDSNATRFKRQRIERGENLDSPREESEPEAEQTIPSPKKKIKKEFDILAVAAQNREQEEARARAEKEDMAQLPDDIDLSEIRRLNIVEEMEVRRPPQARSREQDIASGRWDPKWNGMKNFKKFRQRGEAPGRAPTRTIVALIEVKNKEFGVGDDYWLEDEEPDHKRFERQKDLPTARKSGTLAQSTKPRPPPAAQRRTVGIILSESSQDEEEVTQNSSAAPLTRTRATRASASESQANNRTSQSSRTTSQGSKRAAAEPAGGQQPTKRQRPTRQVVEVVDSDDSDDELKFRFGKRR